MEISDPIRGASEPGRFWTQTNVAEATPDILSPLGWSVWAVGIEQGARAAWHDFGILPRREVRQSDDPNQMITSCFFGRQAMNVDLTRQLMAGIPGTTADDFERDILGTVRPDATPVPNSYRRLPLIAVKAPVVLASQSRRIRGLHEGQGDWWRREVLHSPRSGDPGVRLLDATERFRQAMHIHVRTRFLVQGLQSQVVLLAERVGRSELAPRLLAGAGDLAETALADDLWQLAQGDLGREEFLRRHGYHGPNEGNVFTRSWREDPAPVEALVASLVARSGEPRPRHRVEAVVRDRQEAEAELVGRLPRLRRAGARVTCRLARTNIRNLELGKAAFLMALDGCRAAARDRGAELVDAGMLGEVDDAFYFTVPELTGDFPAEAAGEIVVFRRARREEYRRMQIPVSFTGMPEPLVAAPAAGGDPRPPVITGVAGSPGVVEGPARVILDPDGAEPIEPGEILVCRFTDPGWAPFFTLAAALVIDIGGPASHGAIVARELGIPCVIGTGDGTTRLHTGDRVRVDGASGKVEILEPA